MKLETRTFVSITPPQAEIERPLQVTPYSPPLDEMDLFRCPFMQTIRVCSCVNQLTDSLIIPIVSRLRPFLLPIECQYTFQNPYISLKRSQYL